MASHIIIFLIGVFVGALANAKFRNKVFTFFKSLSKEQKKRRGAK